MPVTNSRKLCPGYQPIDGYTLEEMIGRGGFGEVWRADAPGGLKKAVKFVFGDHEDHRAERELKSLERIKGVQHPFLLALERFEIVDGQLVIVTELADGSLEDIYKKHRDRGSCGIPRDALLTYVGDAADALDYLHEMYQLQHLDIKPANLLMVGGHVKVADFGLVKDLRDVDCSIIGGLTPIYAPPEVFDGRPSMNSDQYSLAVMYQELLTGVRPFSGRTIAQLATQHVHNAPNLDQLPSSDQPVIARALEKNPDRRYTNCREFINELRNPNRRGSAVGMIETTTGAANIASGLAPNEVEDLPQIDGQATNKSLNANQVSESTPVVVIALGGTGIQCVAQLRRQLAASSDTPIALHAVAIDTDANDLRELKQSEPTKGTSVCETLHTPLRSAHEYRERGTEHLRSISRRWIYNVPRGGQTEGMRPLGRMALVDHGADVVNAIEKVVGAAVDSSPQVAPQVFVVGSTSGGTASGMFMDTVHILRDSLDQASLEGVRIVSLMIAPAMRSDPRRPLVLHDTLTTLGEIKHFMKPGNGYPGDTGAGWNSIPAARTPLRDTYVIAASTEPGMPSPIQSACEYIWLHGTGASELLNSARRGAEEETITIKDSAVRTVGVIQLTGARTRDQRVLASTAARQLFMQWIGNPHDAREAAGTLADRMKRRARIGMSEFAETITQSFGEDRNARRAKLMMFLRSLPVDQLRDDQQCREALKEFVAANCRLRNTTALLHETTDAVQRELSTRLHDRDNDLASAIEAVRIFSDKLLSECDNHRSQVDFNVALDLVTSGHQSERDGSPTQTNQDDGSGGLIRVLRHATAIGEELVDQFACFHAKEQISAFREVLSRLEDRLGDGAAKVAQAVRAAEKGIRTQQDPWQALSKRVRRKVTPMLAEVHGRIAHRWLVRLLSDAAVTVDPVEMATSMTAEFESLIADDHRSLSKTHQYLGTSTAATDTNASISSTTETNPSLSASRDSTSSVVRDSMTLTSALGEVNQNAMLIRPPTVEDAINVVRPPLLDCGGSQRLILIVGSEEDKSQYEASVRQAHQGELTVAVVPGCVPTLVHEAQRIKIDEITSRLETLTGGQSEISRRLLSRCDVEWSGN